MFRLRDYLILLAFAIVSTIVAGGVYYWLKMGA
jgi:hypothetical protein